MDRDPGAPAEEEATPPAGGVLLQTPDILILTASSDRQRRHDEMDGAQEDQKKAAKKAENGESEHLDKAEKERMGGQGAVEGAMREEPVTLTQTTDTPKTQYLYPQNPKKDSSGAAGMSTEVDDAATISSSATPAPPALNRSVAVRNQRPGAVRVRPGSSQGEEDSADFASQEDFTAEQTVKSATDVEQPVVHASTKMIDAVSRQDLEQKIRDRTAEAIVLTDDGTRNPDDDGNQSKQRRNYLIYGLVALLVLIGVIVGVVVGISAGGGEDGISSDNRSEEGSSGDFAPSSGLGLGLSTLAPTASPKASLMNYLKDLLGNKGAPLLDDTESVEFRTYQTLAKVLSPGSSPSGTQDEILLNPEDKEILNYVKTFFALAYFYYSDRGDTTWIAQDGWASPGQICDWHGITCEVDVEDNFDVVTQIVLPNNNLTGPLPDTFSWITTLRVLNVEQNSLSSDLPASYSKLQNLEEVHFGFNEIYDNIPFHWRNNMRTIRIFDIQHNSIKDIGAEEHDWTQNSFEILRFNSNKFGVTSHEIVASRWSPHVRVFDITDSGIKGSLPDDFGLNWTSITDISMGLNPDLQGTISPELCANIQKNDGVISIDCTGSIACSCCQCA